MSENEKKVPKRRFKEFENAEAWKPRKLGHITSYIKGFAFKSVDYKVDGIRIIRVSDLSKDCVSEYVDKIYIDKNKAKQYISYTINNGDIVITTVGSKAELKESAVGRPIIFTENKGYLLNQNLVKIAPIQNYDSQFIYNQLLSERYTKYIVDIQRGNANQANITISDLWEYSLQCPAFAEQKKIGQFFNQLDNLIILHQHKLDKMKALKEAYLTEMFPAEGERKPKLRFAGFTDNWEQRQLGKVSKLSSSKRVHREDYKETGIPFFRGLEISKLGSSSKLEDLLYISEQYYKNLKYKYGVPQIGDILITAVGTLGNSYLIRDNTPFYFKDGNLIWLSDIKINSQYLNIYLGDGIGKKRVLESAVGSNQKALTMVMLQNVQVLFPSKEEQRKIGIFFQNFDNLITLHQRKLEKLQNIKKAYLNEMFI